MVEKSERRWLIITGLVMLTVTTLPYLAGYIQQGTDWRFTGFLFGLEDGNSYIAKMLTGTYGSWLFRSPYSAMPQAGVLAFLPYILLGKLAYPPESHDQLVVLFQIFRWLAGGLLIWSTYVFCSQFIENIRYRRLATLVILVGGGLGWINLLVNPGNAGWGGSLEIYSPEAFGFLSLLGLPHLAASRGLLLLGFIYYIRPAENRAWWKNALKGGLCWLAVGFFQPLTIVIGYAILGICLAIRFITAGKNDGKSLLPDVYKAVLMGTLASPWVIYNFFFFNTDGYLRIWYQQNIINSPPVMDYVLSFGLFFLAGLPAIWKILRTKEPKAVILPAWILCAVILAYVPYNLQRRFIDGIWVALVILVFLSLPLVQKKWVKQGISVLAGSTFIATILVMMVISMGVIKPAEPVFRPANEVRMFTAMTKFVKPGEIVSAGYKTANALPAWVPARVIAGHGPESANLKTVLPEVEAFYSGQQDGQWQSEFIQRNGVAYVIYGPEERKTGDWLPVPGLGLVKIYDLKGYQVYRVEHTDEK